MLLGESAFPMFGRTSKSVGNPRSANNPEDKAKSEEKDQSALKDDLARSAFLI